MIDAKHGDSLVRLINIEDDPVGVKDKLAELILKLLSFWN